MPIRLTPTIKYLVIASVACFLIQQTADQFFGTNLMATFALVPSGFVLGHRFWQLFTYSFLHGDVMHLFLNMLMLAFIGSDIESVWGRARFLRFYFACVLGAGFIYLLLQLFIWKDQGLHWPMVGASGGIFGLLLAYGLMFGERVMLFMMLFPMKAKHFVWVLGGIELFSGIYSGHGGLASMAHLGGMLTGMIYLWSSVRVRILKTRFRPRSGGSPKPKKRKASHLRLVTDKPPDFDRDDQPGSDPKTWH